MRLIVRMLHDILPTVRLIVVEEHPRLLRFRLFGIHGVVLSCIFSFPCPFVLSPRREGKKTRSR